MTEDEFYGMDTRRADSPEIELGAGWYMEAWQQAHRLTFIVATGELALISHDGEYCELIGWFPDEGSCRKVVEKVAGELHGRGKGVYELRKQVRSKGVAGDAVTEDHRRRAWARHVGAVGDSPSALF